MDLVSIGIGAAGVVAFYLVCLAATHGTSWLVSKIKASWAGIESAAASDINKAIAALEADVKAIKAKLGL